MAAIGCHGPGHPRGVGGTAMEAVLALARLRGEEVAALSGRAVRVAVVDHLIEPVAHTRAGEFGGQGGRRRGPSPR